MKINSQSKINKHKISQIHPQITSTTPFYIDRRLRIPFIHQNGCLSPHRRQEIPHFDFSMALTSRNGTISRRGDESCRSCQLSPRVQNRRIALQWDILKTLLFKQNLKDILKKYYEIKQRQLVYVSQKVHKERLEQLQKISKSFEKLFLQNRKTYKKIKQTSRNMKKSQQLKREKLRNLDQIISPLPSLQEFVQNVFINDENLPQNKIDEDLIQERIQELFQNDFFKDANHFQDFKGKKLSQGKQSEINSSEEAAMIQGLKKKQEKAGKRSFIQSMRNYFNMNNSSSLTNISQEEKQNMIQQCVNIAQDEQLSSEMKKLMEEKLMNDTGEDKFYKVIKQLLMRTKIDKSIQNSLLTKQAQFKENTDTNQVIKLKENKKSEKKLAGILKNVNQQKSSKKEGPNPNDTLASFTLKSVRIADQTAKEKTKQTKLVRNLSTRKQNQYKQIQKKQGSIKEKKSLKKGKNQNEIKIQKSKSKQEPKIDSKIGKGEKLKLKNRLQKGINYVKFINKMLKAAENERLNNIPQKYKFFKKINTRQAVLSKKKYIEGGFQQPVQIEDENKKIINKKKSTSKSFSSSSGDSEKKGKMTKYQQARLMYNMRNIKSRQLISTVTTPPNQIDDDSHKRKRPSFCNLMVNNDSQMKFRSRRGSFNRCEDDNEGFFPSASTRTVKRSSKLKFSANSSRFLNIQKAELKELQNFQDFDLREVKENIASYLRKFMPFNEKANELYNFLMYMEQSRKVTLEQQEINSSLDHLKMKKELEDIKTVVNQIQPTVEEYQGFTHLLQNVKWNEKDLSLVNKKFFDKLDARSIQILYWNNDEKANVDQGIGQCSLKEIRNLPV